jgi:hypothetical protein
METSTATSILITVPFLVPLAGLGFFLLLYAISSLVIFVIMFAALKPLRAPAIVPGSDISGNNGATGATLLTYTLETQIPGWGAFAGMYTIILSQLGNLLTSLAAFFSAGFIIILLSAIVAAAGFALMFFGNDLLAAWGQTYQCQVLPVLNPILTVINTLNYLIGSVYPLVTYVFSLLFLMTGLLYRIILTCVISNAELVLFGVIQAIGNILLAFWTAVQTFLTSNDLAHARLNMLPTMTAVASLGDSFVVVLDCMCAYLDFLWEATFALLGDQSLARAVDCATNFPIRLVQGFVLALNNSRSIDFGPPTIEAQCVVQASGDFFEVIVLYILNLAVDFVNFIPLAISASPDVATNAQLLGLSTSDMSSMRVNMASGQSTTVDTVRIIMAIRNNKADILMRAAATNASDLIGLGYLIGIAGTPYSRIFTGLVNAVLAGVNNTANLALMATEATGTYSDIKFFQVRILLFSFSF